MDWLAGLGTLLLVGCAVGSEPDTATTELASTPLDAGTEGDSSIILAPPSPDPARDAGSKAASTDAGPVVAHPVSTCGATNTCLAATDLGYVSGDVGSDSAVTSGVTSSWLTVRVGEDDPALLGNTLELNAILTSPPGANYDLFVYLPGSDTRECSAISSQSTSTTSTDQVGLEFGEFGTFANGINDSRTLTIEVRHVSGSCDPTAKWTLNLYGNQH